MAVIMWEASQQCGYVGGRRCNFLRLLVKVS